MKKRNILLTVLCAAILIAACILVGILCRNRGNADAGDGTPSVGTDSSAPATESTAETRKQPPLVKYSDYKDSTSLMKIKPLQKYGTLYYATVTHSDRDTSECVVIEAEVETDYYAHVSEGEILYIAFPTEFEYNGNVHKIDGDALAQAILQCESIILYTQPDELFLYFGDREFTQVVRDVNGKRIAYNSYYSEGIIPISDSAVDYTKIERVLNADSDVADLHSYFENILDSGFSVLPGASVEEAERIVRELVSKKIYGGDMYGMVDF